MKSDYFVFPNCINTICHQKTKKKKTRKEIPIKLKKKSFLFTLISITFKVAIKSKYGRQIKHHSYLHIVHTIMSLTLNKIEIQYNNVRLLEIIVYLFFIIKLFEFNTRCYYQISVITILTT